MIWASPQSSCWTRHFHYEKEKSEVLLSAPSVKDDCFNNLDLIAMT
jgi:hypothetical protein